MSGGADARLAFSPDGRWLLAGLQHEYRIWNVGDWHAAPRLLPRDNPGFWAGPAGFSRDGRLLAVAHTPLEIQLVDVATFQEVARLLAPDARHIECPRFSPDGSQLAVATQNRVIQLWDLRAVRQELGKMGLDWDLPAYPDDTAATGERLQLVLHPDTIEAENLAVVACGKGNWSVRDTSGRMEARWSNDRVVHAEIEKGGYLELEVEVSRAGHYALGIYFSKGPDFGMVEVAVDGKKLLERFDGFNKRIARADKTNFGTLTLTAGRHRLRFIAVGKNPRARRYDLVVDCLELLPADRAPGE
jgi:WD40 repeat protein